MLLFFILNATSRATVAFTLRIYPDKIGTTRRIPKVSRCELSSSKSLRWREYIDEMSDWRTSDSQANLRFTRELQFIPLKGEGVRFYFVGVGITFAGLQGERNEVAGRLSPGRAKIKR